MCRLYTMHKLFAFLLLAFANAYPLCNDIYKQHEYLEKERNMFSISTDKSPFDGEYLLPELKHMDFIWWIRGEWIEDEKVNDILQTVRGIKGVQLVAELTPDQIKNKGHLIFE